MERKPVRQWMLLMAWLVFLVIIVIHSGYLCKQLCFIVKQFFPVAGAGVLALVLNHPYEYVRNFYEEKVKIPKKAARIAGLVTVYLLVIGTVAAVVRFALPRLIESIQQFIENRNDYIQAFETSLTSLTEKIGIGKLDISPLIEGISDYMGRLDQKMSVWMPEMARMTTGLFGRLAVFGIVVVLSVYVLYDKEKIKGQMKRLYRAYMPESIYQPVKHFIFTALQVFDNFVAGQGIESLFLGMLCFLGMFLMRLEYSGLVSLIVGMTAFIPFLGAYIGGGIGVVLLLFISTKKAFTFLVFFIILQQVENNVIYPRVVGKRTGLPGLWVLAAVTVGGGLFGIAGMVLSVPSATLFYVLLKQSVEKREKMKSAGQNKKNEL